MSTTRPFQLLVVPDARAVAERAAHLFINTAREAISDRGRFAVALSGGRTPQTLYGMLAAEPYRNQVDWKNVFFFWGDERSVPPDHPDSNFRMAWDALLAPLEIPPTNIFRIETEAGAILAAARYRQTLTDFFGVDQLPRFDLIHLGMGDDGHTASLFPETSALQEIQTTVTENYVPKLNTDRVTLTIPVINLARQVHFLVTGAGKAERLAEVLEGELNPHHLPSQFVKPHHGAVTWIVDEAAAARLNRT